MAVLHGRLASPLRQHPCHDRHAQIRYLAVVERWPPDRHY